RDGELLRAARSASERGRARPDRHADEQTSAGRSTHPGPAWTIAAANQRDGAAGRRGGGSRLTGFGWWPLRGPGRIDRRWWLDGTLKTATKSTRIVSTQSARLGAARYMARPRHLPMS